MDLGDIYRTLHPKEYTFFEVVFIKLSPKLITYKDTKQISINIRKLK